MEDLRRDLIITSGHYEESVNKITGEVYKMAKSLQFSKMDDTEFSQVYEDVKEVIIQWLGIDNESLEQELLQYF